MINGLQQKIAVTNTQLRTKPNYAAWWHRAAAWAVRVLFWLVRALSLGAANPLFDRYWTTFGSVIYAPRGHDVDLTNPYDYAVVCHELAHRYDDEAHGLRFRLGYIFSGRARARWEMRGYGMQLVAIYRMTGEVPSHWPRRFAEAISGPAYLWAADRQKALETFSAIADALRAGRLSPAIFDPNDERFEEYLP